MALDSTVRQLPPDEAEYQPWSGMAPGDEDPAPGTSIVTVGEDGSVTIDTVKADAPDRDGGFDENLAERPELQHALAEIAEDILQGIDADISSRQNQITNYTAGLDLLGLMLEQGTNTKGSKRNISKMRDTTLLETIVKAQSQARGELLPARGPAKIETTPESSTEEQQLADDFETDFNQALVKGMPEYVPDLDRGLFGFFYSGNMFREGFHHPLLGRPSVATISTEDLIVSEEATDLQTATRVTKRIPEMAPNEVKRRQYHGLWRDCDLGAPGSNIDPELQKQKEIAGLTQLTSRPKDTPFCIYSTITDLDLTMYGLKPEPGSPKTLPLPYRVTIERYSRQVLRIERFWKEGDKRFTRKRRIIHYTMVPGFGFLAYGFLQLQGNQVRGLTAILRLMVDALMFSIFPGGVKAKVGRTDTNEIDPSPGQFVDIGLPAGTTNVRDALMPFPYKDLNPVGIQLYDMVQQAASRMGAAAMMEVGEGRANVPVGTIMAMLEEKSVVMGAVHKRMHDAMSQELSMIRELFVERPESLAEVAPNPTRQWQEAQEFEDLNLVPASDPNVPSQVHRVMIATALATLSGMPQFQGMMDLQDVLKSVLQTIGAAGIAQTVHAPPAQQPDQGPALAAQATLQAKQMDLQAKQADTQRKAASEAVDATGKQQELQANLANDAADRQSDERIAALREQTERVRLDAEQARAAATLQHAKDQTVLEHHRAEADRATRSFGGNQI